MSSREPSIGWLVRLGALTRVLLAGAAVLCLSVPLSAQIKDEVHVYADDSSNGYAESVVRFSRKLLPVGATSVKSYGGSGLAKSTPLAIDGLGRSWIALDPLDTTYLVRIDNVGSLLPHTVLSHHPVNVVVDADGRAFASTRIGLLSPGPAYGVAADGTVLWSNMSGPALFSLAYPSQLAMTATGELWLGGWTAPSGPAEPLMVRLNTSNGAVTGTLTFPLEAGVCAFGPSGDGTLWALSCGVGYSLFKTQGTQVLQSFPINGGYDGITYEMRVDAQGRPHVVSLEAESWDTKVYRYDPAAPGAPDAAYQFGGKISNWGFGASGEEIFAIVWPQSDPFVRRIERLVLRTGVKSSVPLNPVWPDAEMTRGDHTGWVFANVIDQTGDNDGDGATNRTETLAGSNPYDPLSRPEGPKVYLSFAPTTNAIVLTYVDPDGLLDPAGGLDLSSLALLTGAGTNVWAFILPFLTSVDATPDLTQATATFGLLPLPSNLKIRLEARVKDLTGAEGWDWQVTPPGDL